MNFKTVKFSGEHHPDLMNTLRSRVNEYFKTNRRSRYGDASMIFKTVFMLSLYLIPYLIMVSGLVTGYGMLFVMWLIMGIGMAGIGLSVMHDANHGSYSKNDNVNKILGALINIIGGNSVNWKIQHNVLHHTFTNIDGYDEDIDIKLLLRVTPNQKRQSIHRIQHYYAWFFYSLMTINWVLFKDFMQMHRYSKMGLLKRQNKSYLLQFGEIVFFKIIYLLIFVVIPVMVLPVPVWVCLLFFLSMHLTASLIVGVIFQCAHVMPTSEFPLPDTDGNINTNFALHQLLTTANFSPDSKLFSWFIGGLNYQIEHHLFPNICHIHYRRISGIVKKTASEYGIPYNVHSNFYLAVKNHVKMLKDLGRFDKSSEYCV